MHAGPARPDIAAAVAAIMRSDGGRLLSCLIVNLRDFQLAEDSLQDAFESALIHWQRNGLPQTPAAWLMQAARRKAIDRLRRSATIRAKAGQVALLDEMLRAEEPESEAIDSIGDERLKLIFTCCHPALDRSTSVALTLRSVAGLTTDEIARAYVVSTDTMAQRLVRARHKIAAAGIAYDVPAPESLPERLDAVLTVLYLLFNEGHTASDGSLTRPEFCEEAIRLCTLLDTLLPRQSEVEGLLALMLLNAARQPARLDAAGDMVELERQDRRLWDRDRTARGAALVERALCRGSPGPYQMQAAIAAIHAEAPSFAETDWGQIALIYAALIRLRPNPVYELNRIVAVSYRDGPQAVLAVMAGLGQALATYQPYHAVRADLLARVGSAQAARDAYDLAISLSGSEPERRFLAARRNAI